MHPCDRLGERRLSRPLSSEIIVPTLVGPRCQDREHRPRASPRHRLNSCWSTRRTAMRRPTRRSAVRAGKVEALMKGGLHTDELMHAVVVATRPAHRAADQPCLHHRRADHSERCSSPTPRSTSTRPRRQSATSCRTRSIWRTRWDREAARRDPLGGREVTAKIPSTLDAAALCKMADRGQITGGILDGPLAFDNAVTARPPRSRALSRRSPGGPNPRRSRPRSRQHAGEELATR